MDSVSKEQIRQFRLHTHPLDTWFRRLMWRALLTLVVFKIRRPAHGKLHYITVSLIANRRI